MEVNPIVLKQKTSRMDELTGPHHIQLENWISCAPFERLLHMEIVEALDGRAILTMPFLVDFAQGGGLMHGGALVGLADTAVAMAIKSLVPPETWFVTVSMKTKFLYPVKRGIVTAKSRVTDREGDTWKAQATVFDEEERAVMEFFSIFKIVRRT